MTKIIQDVKFGHNLKKIRNAKGYTQKDICTKLDLMGRPTLQSTYAQIESGKRNIFLSDLIALKQILDVNYDELFEGIKPINKNKQNGNKS